jgi:hypothetical protein
MTGAASEAHRFEADDLFTVALRPHSIFGPNDPHLLPALRRAANSGVCRPPALPLPCPAAADRQGTGL